jgi:hydrogenase maturation protein HypF
MARDVDAIRRYARLSGEETALLQAPAAPIVLLDRLAPVLGAAEIAPGVAPGQATLGFMRPYSPLHHLLLADWERPLVMTSGNLSEEPQCTENADALADLGAIADALLLHDRGIVNRVDDSVVRVMEGAPRLLRRARGYAPEPLPLPPGFEDARPVLALGGELKSAICLLGDGRAVLSQHLGDLEEVRTAREYARTIDLYGQLFQHRPSVIAVDAHPDYRSSQLGRDWAAREGLALIEVQHHHAHIASVLGEHGWPRDAGPVLGLALDGLGWGGDGTLWGGELLVADYRDCVRVGHLRPVPMPGGVKAILEPWRNAYAQLASHLGWDAYRERYPDLDLTRFLDAKPLGVLTTMVERGINAPLSSACGRLFDAVAAAVGVCRERLSYEGQAAIELEALAAGVPIVPDEGYPFAVTESDGCLVLDATPMWLALLDDLAQGVAPGACPGTRDRRRLGRRATKPHIVRGYRGGTAPAGARPARPASGPPQ